MTLNDYREIWSGSPNFISEFAEAAMLVEDDDEFSTAARTFLDAMNAFEAALDRTDVVIG
jgi:hypothetical protein